MGKFLNLMVITVAAIMVGCTGNGTTQNGSLQNDSVFREAAMSCYAYQPENALHIIDSAVAVGAMTTWRADVFRTRIYSSTQMYDQMDSLLGGPKGVRLDSARAVGERLLTHDSIKANQKRLLDVLEILSNTARLQDDTTRWLLRSREYVDVCRQLGASQATNAMRTEAEIGAALCAKGQREQGMEKLDSAIFQLEASFHSEQHPGRFAELDALIIALKRKIVQLASTDNDAETLPLARLIIERLDDYEQHPDLYHDGSYREPKTDEKRADYIHFYRSQAQGYLTAAYTALGERGDMLDAFSKIDSSVRVATAREHHAHYKILQQQMEIERQQNLANRFSLIAMAMGIFVLLLLVIVFVGFAYYRAISRKNRYLAQQITEAARYKELYFENKQGESVTAVDPDNLNALTDEQLFHYVDQVIMSERLYLDPNFGRQTIMERFQISKERVGALFSRFSNHSKLSNYVTRLRLEYASQLLAERPSMSIVSIASKCGFSSKTYFSTCFRQHYGMSPSVFRAEVFSSSQQDTESDDKNA